LLLDGRTQVEVRGLRGVSQLLRQGVLGRRVRQDSLLGLDEVDAVEVGTHLELEPATVAQVDGLSQFPPQGGLHGPVERPQGLAYRLAELCLFHGYSSPRMTRWPNASFKARRQPVPLEGQAPS